MSNSTALDRYNRLFNNAAYRQVSGAVEAYGCQLSHLPRERLTDLMNALTDVALGMCGDERFTSSYVTLAILCANMQLHSDLVEQMAAYLRLYNEQDDQVGDFISLTHTLKAVAHARDELQLAVSHANAIHSKNGNAAYHLLAACDLITLAAQQVLQNGDEGYIAEKLERGAQRLLNMK